MLSYVNFCRVSPCDCHVLRMHPCCAMLGRLGGLGNSRSCCRCKWCRLRLVVPTKHTDGAFGSVEYRTAAWYTREHANWDTDSDACDESHVSDYSRVTRRMAKKASSGLLIEIPTCKLFATCICRASCSFVRHCENTEMSVYPHCKN